uniref:Uncharacterized protein n=1 Tax=Panagrolaimus sp. ES5 TaxID=591445 RepID=A0AC34G989_9BILA
KSKASSKIQLGAQEMDFLPPAFDSSKRFYYISDYGKSFKVIENFEDHRLLHDGKIHALFRCNKTDNCPRRLKVYGYNFNDIRNGMEAEADVIGEHNCGITEAERNLNMEKFKKLEELYKKDSMI